MTPDELWAYNRRKDHERKERAAAAAAQAETPPTEDRTLRWTGKGWKEVTGPKGVGPRR